ncbi:hypothetical protein [Apilactobacillus xinyiensis]|uniref:hypothetical protein n=1 Tax=Apilactobacillus xinyiensis TaxID=2841032 RepID=UPI003364D535
MLEALGHLLAIAWFFITIAVIVYWLKSRKVKKQNPNDYRTLNRENGNYDKLKKLIIAMIATFILASLFLAPSENRKEAKEHKVAVAKKKADSKKKAVEDKKKAEDKKEADFVKTTKEDNEKKNLAAYKKDLNTIPEKTKGIISKAYIDESGSEQTTVVLSNEALNVSDNELKNIAHEAYNYMENFISNYKPLPDDSLADSIRIIDSSGNLIAKTSWGNYKYVGK